MNSWAESCCLLAGTCMGCLWGEGPRKEMKIQQGKMMKVGEDEGDQIATGKLS